MANEKKDFENKLQRVSEIADTLESKTLPLDESVALFEEGQKLIKELSKELEEAKNKIEEITTK